MLVASIRLGIGLDIEHNEDIIHRVVYENDDGTDEEALLCFNGLIVKLPFLTIMFGDFINLDDVLASEAN